MSQQQQGRYRDDTGQCTSQQCDRRGRADHRVAADLLAHRPARDVALVVPGLGALAHEQESWKEAFLYEAVMVRDSDVIIFLGNTRCHETPLDAGCGIGLISQLLAQAVAPGGHVTGLDLAGHAWTLTSGDGEKTVYARITDQAGNKVEDSALIERDIMTYTDGAKVEEGIDNTLFVLLTAAF